MRSDNLAIKLTRVTKYYRLKLEKPTLVESVVRRQKKDRFVALDSVSLEIKKGEKIAIIGHNGSGKTTLLKTITGITTPNLGKVEVWGKVVSLIDLGAGFHPELTGRENVFLNAMMVGMTRKEARHKFEEIVDFSGVGGFIDAPFYTYSSGMKLRLGFAVAVAADPDVLILDEGISVGDRDFQEKSTAKIEEFFRMKKTIVMVSHWHGYLREHANRFIWMDKGVLVADGAVEVLDDYLAETSGLVHN